MNKIYSYEDIEKLSQKIQKIKRKKNLEDIRDIIINNNAALNITENSNGIYLCFNQLSNDTFIKVDKYVKKYLEIENNKKNSTDVAITITSTIEEEKKVTSYIQENYLFDDNSRLKYSNKEKNLIKKRLYDKALKINSEVNDYEKNIKSDTINTSDIMTSTTIMSNKAEKQNIDIFMKKNKKVDK
jgi:hypothetical protein